MRWAIALVLPLTFLPACKSDSFKPEPRFNDPELFWSLQLNHQSVLLSLTAPYNTLPLLATPSNYQGVALTGLPAPQYLSRDFDKVAVTAEGVLTAVTPTSQPVWVVATLTSENLKLMDSVIVKVADVSPPPVLASFSVHPVPPDSAKLATRTYTTGVLLNYPVDTLRAQAADAGGVPLDTIAGGLPIRFRSSDPTIASIHPFRGIVIGLKPGAVTFYANTTIFGTTKADTLPYQIGLPIMGHIRIGDPALGQPPGLFLEPEFRVATGASIFWTHEDFPGGTLSGFSISEFLALYGAVVAPKMAFKVDVTFDDVDVPNVVASNKMISSSGNTGGSANQCVVSSVWGDCTNGGNIVLGSDEIYDFMHPPASRPVLFAVRAFPMPGTYEYRSTIHGTRGRIIVVDD